MYKLLVYFPGEQIPQAAYTVDRAAEVLIRLPGVLAAHAGCETVVIQSHGVRLFAVDGAGNRIP